MKLRKLVWSLALAWSVIIGAAVGVAAQTIANVVAFPSNIDLTASPTLYLGNAQNTPTEGIEGMKQVAANGKLVLTAADALSQANGQYAFNVKYFLLGTPAAQAFTASDFMVRMRVGQKVINQHTGKFTTGDTVRNNTRLRLVYTQFYLAAGENLITLSLDDDQKISETSEGNNTYSFTVIVQPSPPVKAVNLPTPILEWKSLNKNSVGSDGKSYLGLTFSITNASSFADELFAPAPQLAACGLNKNASRTWLNIYDFATDQPLYGFCGLGKSSDLSSLSFNIAPGKVANCIYITLTDRQTQKIVRSNPINLLAGGPAGCIQFGGKP